MADAAQRFNEPYETAFTRDFASASAKLSAPAFTSALRKDGHATIDGFFGLPWASALLQEARWLANRELLQPNRTAFGRQVFSKPNIFESDLHDASVRTRVPELEALFAQEDVVGALRGALPELSLTHGRDGKTVKLQWNRGGGGCFPMHYDNAGAPSKRRLTCLCYLNPDWAPGDGGELQLQPFLGAAVTVRPLMDRMVVFYSERLLHRVTPCSKSRYCFTVWLDGEGCNRPQDLTLQLPASALSDVRGTAALLRDSPAQRVLSRAVYSEEYLLGLEQCLLGCDVTPQGVRELHEQMVAEHEARLAQLRASPGVARIVDALRKFRDDEARAAAATEESKDNESADGAGADAAAECETQ